MLWALIFPTLAIHAQKTGKYDSGKPFGWAVSGSLEGGCYNLNGGEGGKSITLKSNGGDMAKTIQKALQEYDIVVLDGSNGPFVIGKTIRAEQLENKTICGCNGALLTTSFKMTSDIKALLDSANVKALEDFWRRLHTQQRQPCQRGSRIPRAPTADRLPERPQGRIPPLGYPQSEGM